MTPNKNISANKHTHASLAAAYDKIYLKQPARWNVQNAKKPFVIDVAIKDELTKMYPYHPTISILDMGCGNGRTIQYIRQSWMKIIGLDFSQEAIKLAEKKNPGITFYCCNLLYAPFRLN